MTIQIKIQQLTSGQGMPLPEYQSEGAAGFDLMAAIPDDCSVIIEPHARELVPTGIALEIPDGFEAQVRSRSGLAIRHGVCVLNSPGTIDSDYRGEVGVILINLGSEPFRIDRGLRIAQLVVAPVARVKFLGVESLAQSTRGSGGFGSTGLAATTSNNAPEEKGQ